MYGKIWRIVGYCFLLAFVLLVLSFKIFPDVRIFCENISLSITSKSLKFVDFVFSPVNNLVSKIKSNSVLRDENAQLKIQLLSYENIQKQNILLEKENTRLKSVLKYHKLHKKNFVTAKTIGLVHNPFTNNLIIDKGYTDGIKIDNIVFSNNYVIGKVKALTKDYSLVSLITDPKSRVSVITKTSKEKALLANINGKMQLTYLDKNHQLKLHEEIVTSNFSKSYYTNLPIGFVSEITDNLASVVLYVDFMQIDFVSVELMDDDKLKQIRDLENQSY